VRGGSFAHNAFYVRSADRSRFDEAAYRGYNFGFRPARTFR
jgi:hypothetical protein